MAHQVADLLPLDVVEVAAIRATTPTRTLIDIAAIEEPARVEAALDDAIRRRLTSIRRLAWRIEALRRPGRAGPAVLDVLLRDRDRGRTESPLEDRLLRILLRAGLPRPAIQHEVRAAGRVLARVDLAYPDHRIALEADGYAWHSSRERWQRDLVRGNALQRAGWRVLRFSAHDIGSTPDHIALTVREALGKVVTEEVAWNRSRASGSTGSPT